MLTHPTHERLITLGLTGMAKALEEQRRSPDLDVLSFEERVGLLVDREAAERDTKRLTTRLKFAALRQSACVEDVDLRTPRGIDRAVFARLVGGDWIDRNENLLITGATGLGKSWIACALGQKACRDIARSSITASRACSRRSPLLAATVAMAACSKTSAAFSSWSSTIGVCQFSIRLNGATFWRSLMIATVAPRPSSPVKSPSNSGMTSSATPPWATPSWTVSFTTLTASSSPEKACERRTPAIKLLTPTPTPEPITMSVKATAQDRVKYLLTIKRNERSPSSEIPAHHHRNAHPASIRPCTRRLPHRANAKKVLA